MEILFFWLVFSGVVAAVASHRGRSGFGWFCFSLFLSPLIGLVAVLCLDRKTPSSDNGVARQGTLKRCPFCAEEIQLAAIRCKHCHATLDQAGR